jgi:murein DD-endopeptidase MepM/ murein hydrolase activator NlpD
VFCISTLRKKLSCLDGTTVSSVVLLLGVFAVSVFVAQNAGESSFLTNNGIFGGPASITFEGSLTNREAALASNYVPHDEYIKIDLELSTSGPIIEATSVLHSANPLGIASLSREGLIVYKVQEGDTLSRIAVNFGISLNTILWANPDLKGNFIRVGQEILILPVSGVLHVVGGGETLESIASDYGVSSEELLVKNKSLGDELPLPGEKLVIPDGRPQEALASVYSSLPNLRGYFKLPTTGWNWRELHNYNAVDIANTCGTEIYAAAEGLVVEVGSPKNWNGGFGGFIDIEHPNGTQTRYAHTQTNLKEVGNFVEGGELIAEMGNTGNTRGISTNCHLHFEVRGARNPFAK